MQFNNENQDLENVLQKHAYIQHWYRGPEMNQDNVFVKGNKIILIEDDDPKETDEQFKEKAEEVLGELIQQNIPPTMFIIGDKNKIWEKMKAEEERISKQKKEFETKKLLKKSDVRMTIYPAFDNFFEQNYNYKMKTDG